MHRYVVAPMEGGGYQLERPSVKNPPPFVQNDGGVLMEGGRYRLERPSVTNPPPFVQFGGGAPKADAENTEDENAPATKKDLKEAVDSIIWPPIEMRDSNMMEMKSRWNQLSKLFAEPGKLNPTQRLLMAGDSMEKFKTAQRKYFSPEDYYQEEDRPPAIGPPAPLEPMGAEALEAEDEEEEDEDEGEEEDEEYEKAPLPIGQAGEVVAAALKRTLTRQKEKSSIYFDTFLKLRTKDGKIVKDDKGKKVNGKKIIDWYSMGQTSPPPPGIHLIRQALVDIGESRVDRDLKPYFEILTKSPSTPVESPLAPMQKAKAHLPMESPKTRLSRKEPIRKD